MRICKHSSSDSCSADFGVSDLPEKQYHWGLDDQQFDNLDALQAGRKWGKQEKVLVFLHDSRVWFRAAADGNIWSSAAYRPANSVLAAYVLIYCTCT